MALWSHFLVLHYEHDPCWIIKLPKTTRLQCGILLRNLWVRFIQGSWIWPFFCWNHVGLVFLIIWIDKAFEIYTLRKIPPPPDNTRNFPLLGPSLLPMPSGPKCGHPTCSVESTRQSWPDGPFKNGCTLNMPSSLPGACLSRKAGWPVPKRRELLMFFG